MVAHRWHVASLNGDSQVPVAHTMFRCRDCGLKRYIAPIGPNSEDRDIWILGIALVTPDADGIPKCPPTAHERAPF